MPVPSVNMIQNKALGFFRDDSLPERFLVAFNVQKCKDWLDDTAKLLGDPSVLFATVSDNKVVASLTNEAVAVAYEQKWGGAA